MSARRLVATIAVLAVVVFGCTGWRPSVDAPASSPPTTQDLSDSAIKSLMIVNLKSIPDATSAIPLDATRTLDILVRHGVLMVATTDPSSAASLCRTVAGMTNSPDTGAPLGITEVVIIVPVQQPVATCRP